MVNQKIASSGMSPSKKVPKYQPDTIEVPRYIESDVCYVLWLHVSHLDIFVFDWSSPEMSFLVLLDSKKNWLSG